MPDGDLSRVFRPLWRPFPVQFAFNSASLQSHLSQRLPFVRLPSAQNMRSRSLATRHGNARRAAAAQQIHSPDMTRGSKPAPSRFKPGPQTTSKKRAGVLARSQKPINKTHPPKSKRPISILEEEEEETNSGFLEKSKNRG